MYEDINFFYFENYFEEELKEELLLENESQENIISDYFIKQRKNRELIKNSSKIKKF
jgi:hypothetical protein